MVKYVVKRIVLMFITLFIIMTICFVMIKLLPDPIIKSKLAEYKQELALREAWGYNKPILTQYGIFLKKVFTEWDWGYCIRVGTKFMDVTEYIAMKLPATIAVNLYSVIISVPLGILFGIYAALKKNKWQDQVINVIIMIFISVPSYVYAFLVQYFIGYKLGWFPIVIKTGTDYFSWDMFVSMTLPIMALSFGTIAGLMRFTRAELTETLTSDYMLLARAKGLTKMQATVRHALRNAFVPILPMVIGYFVDILTGSLIIERIFQIPGVGNVYVDSIANRDYNLFMAISMFYTAVGLVMGIITDLSYGFIDPRIRMGGGKTNEY